MMCTIRGCDKLATRNLPLCREHRNRVHTQAGVCSFDGCESVSKKHDRCSKHRWWFFCKGCDSQVFFQPNGRKDRDPNGPSYPAPGLTETVRRYCKDCQPAYKQDMRLRYYNIPRQKFDQMWDAQDRKCAVCHEDTDRPCVDHDHSCCPGKLTCGKCVRGLVCIRCNVAIGYLENEELVTRVHRYLLVEAVAS